MCLYETNLVRHIERIKVARQSDVRLFLSIRSDEGVNLCSLDVVELLDGFANLTLVGLYIHNEYERIVLFNLFHRALGVEWRDDGAVLVHSWCMRDRCAWIFGCTGQTECLWTVEGDRGACLALDRRRRSL